MQPRFAALLFALGLADLAYVNLGVGPALFASSLETSGAEASAPRAAPGVATPPALPEPARAAPSVQAPPEEPAARIDGAPAVRDPAPGPSPTPEAVPRDVPLVPQDTPEATTPAPSPAAAAVATPASAAPVAGPQAAAPRLASAPRAADAPAPQPDGDRALEASLTVTFPDKATALLTPAARAELLQLAEHLRQHPDTRLHIVGHADARGTREFNQTLGARRARAVSELLGAAGVPRTQLVLESRGEDEPREAGAFEEAWAANRRVEISIASEKE